MAVEEIRTHEQAKELTSLGIRVVMWKNTLTIIHDHQHPLIGYGTGSFEEAYRRLVGPEDPRMETLETFHRQHEPSETACSVLMFRPDACTQSLTRIEVTGMKAMLHYEPQVWVGANPKAVDRDLDLRN